MPAYEKPPAWPVDVYYHTRRDSWDNLNREGLENCYRAAVRLIETAESAVQDKTQEGA